MHDKAAELFIRSAIIWVLIFSLFIVLNIVFILKFVLGIWTIGCSSSRSSSINSAVKILSRPHRKSWAFCKSTWSSIYIVVLVLFKYWSSAKWHLFYRIVDCEMLSFSITLKMCLDKKRNRKSDPSAWFIWVISRILLIKIEIKSEIGRLPFLFNYLRKPCLQFLFLSIYWLPYDF